VTSHARVVPAFIVAAIAVLAACGGGGGSLPSTGGALGSPPRSASSPGATQAVTFSLAIPAASPGVTTRRRDFVSSATNGAQITVTGPNGARSAAAANLSGTSNACTTSGGTRTCTVAMTVPLGADTFTIATYDEAPVNGAIPAGAQELGIGSVTATISTSTSSVSISIDGLIANLGTLPAFSSLPADGTTHEVPIILAPTDFGDQPIVAGTSDPYANPITVELTESGGTGHAELLYDGTAAGSSVTLKYSTDTVTLKYDGGGAPGYSMTISASASGVAATSTTIGPLFLAGSGLSGDTLTLTAPDTAITVTITEAGAPSSHQYSAGASSGCSGIATATTTSGTGASATFSVTGSSTPSEDLCTILVSDGTVYLNLAVTNEPNGVTPSPTPTPTATPAPSATPSPVGGSGGVTIDGYVFATQGPISGATLTQIVAGPDGNMWFTSVANGIFGYTAASSSPTTTTFSVGAGSGAQAQSLAVASDGNVYFADETGEILLVNPTDGYLQQALNAPSSITPVAIVAVPDGNVYFADNLNSAIWKLTVGGQFTEYSASDYFSSMTLGPDDALWLIDTSGEIERFDLSSDTISGPTALTGSVGNATSIVSDGTNLWVTTTGTKIVRFAPASPGTQSDFANGTAGASQGIALGADSAVWYAVPSKNAVVRMALSTQGTTVFTLSPSVPYSVATGHDGTIWFVDQTNSAIGHLSP
jgi:streptogramin lyase